MADMHVCMRAVELHPIPAKDKHQLLAEMSKGEYYLMCVMIKAVQARPVVTWSVRTCCCSCKHVCYLYTHVRSFHHHMKGCSALEQTWRLRALPRGCSWGVYCCRPLRQIQGLFWEIMLCCAFRHCCVV